MRFTIGLRWKAVKSLAVSNPSLPFEDWGFLLTMEKRTNFFRLETFLLTSLGVHFLLFLILSIFSGDATRSLISAPRLEVHLLSIASPAIAEEKPLPKPISPPFQRKVQPPPLKIQHPEPAPVEKLNPSFQTASSDVPEKEIRRTPPAQNEEKSPQEPPAREATVEWTNSDDESLWVKTAAPSQESPSSSVVIPSPQEVKGYSERGMQEEKTQVAKGVSHVERETRFAHPRYLNNPKPVYPQEAKQRGYQGEVTLRVEVLASGQVGQIEIRRSSGYETLDRSALAAVKQWQFVSAKRGKESIPLWVNIPIKFRIE